MPIHKFRATINFTINSKIEDKRAAAVYAYGLLRKTLEYGNKVFNLVSIHISTRK